MLSPFGPLGKLETLPSDTCNMCDSKKRGLRVAEDYLAAAKKVGPWYGTVFLNEKSPHLIDTTPSVIGVKDCVFFLVEIAGLPLNKGKEIGEL